MPIDVIPGSKAFRSLIETKTARYPTPQRQPERYRPYPSIEHKPLFQIAADDTLFTIGSCFARNIERALIRMGMPVLSSLVEGAAPNENVTNKYTSRSILYDLETAFDPSRNIEDTIYTSDGKSMNLAFGGDWALTPKPTDVVMDMTRRYYETFRKVAEANVIIMTLGLVEVWYDNERKVYLNIAPTQAMVKREPERFSLHVLSHDDILSDLEKIYEQIKKIGRPDVKMLMTVSPVPLHATFRGQDVLQANMYSKAVQRAAVEEFRFRHPEVAYFPSYEMVVMAAPELAWNDDDFRHVRPELVERIMRTVLSNYVDPSAIAPEKDELREMYKTRAFKALLARVDAYLTARRISIYEAPVYVAYYSARTYEKIGHLDQAIPLFEHVQKKWPNHELTKDIL
jgi:hypothetical protein